MSKNKKKIHEDAVSRLIYALNHPLRRQILTALMQEPASATNLAKTVKYPLSNISYHMSEVLFKACEVIQVAKKIPRRGATETVYRINPKLLVGAIDWPSIPEPMRSGLRGVALGSFLGLAIASLEAEGETSKESSLYVYRSVSVDENGQRKINKAAERFANEVAAIEARCATLDAAGLLQLIVGTASFEAAPLPKSKRK